MQKVFGADIGRSEHGMQPHVHPRARTAVYRASCVQHQPKDLLLAGKMVVSSAALGLGYRYYKGRRRSTWETKVENLLLGFLASCISAKVCRKGRLIRAGNV